MWSLWLSGMLTWCDVPIKVHYYYYYYYVFSRRAHLDRRGCWERRAFLGSLDPGYVFWSSFKPVEASLGFVCLFIIYLALSQIGYSCTKFYKQIYLYNRFSVFPLSAAHSLSCMQTCFSNLFDELYKLWHINRIR